MKPERNFIDYVLLVLHLKQIKVTMMAKDKELELKQS